jgi:hypothetical protein
VNPHRTTQAVAPEMLALPTIEQRLQRLEDERSVLDTLHRYGHGLDYGDEQDWLDCWLPGHTQLWPLPGCAAALP